MITGSAPERRLLTGRQFDPQVSGQAHQRYGPSFGRRAEASSPGRHNTRSSLFVLLCSKSCILWLTPKFTLPAATCELEQSAGLQQVEQDSPAGDLRVAVALRVILPKRSGRYPLAHARSESVPGCRARPRRSPSRGNPRSSRPVRQMIVYAAGGVASTWRFADDDEVPGRTEASRAESAQEPGRGPVGQRNHLRPIEHIPQMRVRTDFRPHRHVRTPAAATMPPRRRRPPIASTKRFRLSLVVCTRISQAPAEPRATPTVTALPTSFQLVPFCCSVPAADVQLREKPWSASTSSIEGVTSCRPGRTRSQIPGGDGMPIVEPPLSVGIASRAQPSPRSPSVQ